MSEEEIYCANCQEWKHVDHCCLDRDEEMADDNREREQFSQERE